jgi:hypothetical protein
MDEDLEIDDAPDQRWGAVTMLANQTLNCDLGDGICGRKGWREALPGRSTYAKATWPRVHAAVLCTS